MGRFGPDSRRIFEAGGDTAIAVASTATVYSQSFKIDKGVNFALSIIGGGAGDKDVKVELEQSLVPPTTEGSSDTNFVVPATAPVTLAVTDTTQHHITLSVLPLKYCRLKLTGQGTNAATTTMTAHISQTEEN